MSERLSSVDVFRGITMAGMVVVNNPGSWDAIYWPLEHAVWNGWTPTDLIFPFFVFLVGVSMTLSRQTRSAPPQRILQRGIVIIALGLLIAGFPYFHWQGWRLPGVLQRIGLCYVAAAAIYRSTVDDARAARTVAWVAAAILIAYWLLLVRFGDLTPQGNIGARIDRALMSGHLLHARWDPEGLLGTLPAIATTLLGILAGLWLKAPVERERKLNVLVLAGVALVAAGEAWHAVFPINKQLWTSSYVLLTAGAAAILLAACIYLVDVRGVRGWTHPFVVFGRNAIALYVVAGLLTKCLDLTVIRRADGQYDTLQTLIFSRTFGWIEPPKMASLSYAVVFLAFMYVVCYLMYRKGIFLRA